MKADLERRLKEPLRIRVCKSLIHVSLNFKALDNSRLEISNKIITITIIVFVISLLTSYYLLSIVIKSIYLLTLLSILLSIAISLTVSNVYIISYNNEFKSKLDSEYPILVLVFAILHFAPLYYILFEIIHRFKDILKYSSKLIRSWLFKFHLSNKELSSIIYESLSELPECRFRRFFINYIRILYTGGSIKRFLERSIESILEDIYINWEASWRSLVGRLETTILLYGLTPSILISIVTTLGIHLVYILFLVLILILPVTAIILYSYFDVSLFKIPITVKRNIPLKILFLSILTATIAIFLDIKFFGFDWIRSLTIYLAIGLIPHSIYSLRVWRDYNLDNLELENFLENVEELLRYGFNLFESIRRINLKEYTKHFRIVIKQFLNIIENNIIFSESMLKVDRLSPIFKLTLYMLFEIIKSGGGLKEVIFLREIVSKYVRIMRRKVSSSLPPVLSGVGVIILGTYSFWTVKSLISGIHESIIPFTVILTESLPLIAFLYKTAILINIVISGILISKLIFDDISYTYPLTLFLLTYYVSILIFQI